MDALKAVVGSGKKEQEGQEPISGVQGEGTAVEPFDSGNQQGDSDLGGKAPQDTDTTQVPSQAYDKIADSTTPSGKSEEPIAYAPAAASAPALNESEPSKASNGSESEKPSIGSPGWFKTALPMGQRKDEQPAASAGVAEQVNEPQSGLPPNHLGSNVPTGQISAPVNVPTIHEPAPHDTVGSANTYDSRQGEAAMHDTSPAPTAAHPQAAAMDQEAKEAAERPQQYVSDAGPSQEKSSGGGLFSNPFSSDDKKIETESPVDKRRLSREQFGSNPNAIPTAGGVRIGSVAYERRKSVDPRRSTSLTQPAIPDEDEDAIDAPASSNVTSSPPVSDYRTDTVGSSSVGSTGAKVDDEPVRTSLSPDDGNSKRKGIFGKVKEKLHH
ncbi:hypothetical protein LTR53_011277 [Teratosphaeriaceae sp. CCFEE 6253]|nr:hypothetical protein LTR53_011277 [Teratosphaeriaceae sp. CCFEE 6253]